MRSIRNVGIVGLFVGMVLAACATPASEQTLVREMLVYRSPTCDCCSDWVGYVEERGYTATVEDVENLAAIKADHNVPTDMQSCHTALIDGYVIEGHVPVAEIERLLTERPDVVGIAVPGTPIGSPGTAMEDVEPQPFDVVAFDESGNTEVFASYPQ